MQAPTPQRTAPPSQRHRHHAVNRFALRANRERVLRCFMNQIRTPILRTFVIEAAGRALAFEAMSRREADELPKKNGFATSFGEPDGTQRARCLPRREIA